MHAQLFSSIPFSIWNGTKKHKILVSHIDHLKMIWNFKCFNERLAFYGSIDGLTVWKDSREHEMLPKHLNSTGFCALATIVGIKLRKGWGNKYHLSWSTKKQTPSNSLRTRSPSSQAVKTSANAQNILWIEINSNITSSSSFDWKLKWWSHEVSFDAKLNQFELNTHQIHLKWSIFLINKTKNIDTNNFIPVSMYNKSC